MFELCWIIPFGIRTPCEICLWKPKIERTNSTIVSAAGKLDNYLALTFLSDSYGNIFKRGISFWNRAIISWFWNDRSSFRPGYTSCYLLGFSSCFCLPKHWDSYLFDVVKLLSQIDFFGTSLLKLSRKKRKTDSLTDNDTQSSEDEMKKDDDYQSQPQTKQIQSATSYPEMEIPKQQRLDDLRTSETDSQHARWIFCCWLGSVW